MHDAELNDLEREHLILKSEISAFRMYLAARRLTALLLKGAGFNPDQPRDDHGRWTDGGGDSAQFDKLLASLKGDQIFQDIAYPGDFHDVVRDYVVKALRAGGNAVETEVSLVLPGTPPMAARLDILARGPKGTLFGIDVKTGLNPTFTPGQQVVYPHAIGGAGVISFDSKIRNLKLIPGERLPAFPISVVYANGPGEPLEVVPLPAEPR